MATLNILKQMGYRPLTNDKWGKPVGNGIFIFYVKDNTIDFIFCDAQGKGGVWKDFDFKKYDQEIDLEWLCAVENDLFRQFSYYMAKSQFHFNIADVLMEYYQNVGEIYGS